MNASIKECMCSYSTDRLKNIYETNKNSDSLSERQKYIINVVESELKERGELDEGTWNFDNDKADEIISRLNTARNAGNAGELELIAKEASNVIGDDLVSDALDDAVYAMQMGNKRDADIAIESAIERIEELVELTIDEMLSNLIESVSYREFKQDPTCSPQQKVNKGIAEVSKMLREMEKIVTNNLKLKNEMGVKSDHFWKSTGNRFAKINERMTRISNKLKELSQ